MSTKKYRKQKDKNIYVYISIKENALKKNVVNKTVGTRTCKIVQSPQS